MPVGGTNIGPVPGGMLGGISSNCCCNFPTLVVLILIVLQFSRHRDDNDEDFDRKHFPVGNGILFIIALFFLSCCNACKTSY